MSGLYPTNKTKFVKWIEELFIDLVTYLY
jgi:hypothetical protein